MKRGPNFVLALVLLGIIATIAYRFDQYLIKHNYVIVANVPCDELTEECFVIDCDPSEDTECDVTPYKKAVVLASEAPACVQEHTCESFACDGLSSCEITYCSEDALEDGEICAASLALPHMEESQESEEESETTAPQEQE